jgi:predicted phosphohydrolase
VKRIAWCTDIHLNFLEKDGREHFADKVERAHADAVVVSGDITVAPKLETHLEEMASEIKAPIYFVLGNHDFWGSSFAAVQDRMKKLSARSPRLHWLGCSGVVALSEKTALVGDDGWYDGRFGDYERSRILLNDFVRVEDFAYMGKAQRLTKLNALGDESAARLRALLEKVDRDEVIVATHVPPFRDAAWYDGVISNDDWLPLMSCKAAGEAILESARAHPGRRFTVLCGHTHGQGEARLAPNLLVKTGAAEYGSPELQPLIEVA